jgi:hypothetical protein
MCFTNLSETTYKIEERKCDSCFGDFNRSQDREHRRSEENAEASSFNDLISNVETSRQARFDDKIATAQYQ